MVEKSPVNIKPSLWHAYSESFFRFHQQWDIASYAIITAWNPYSDLRSKEDNHRRNHELEQQLKHVKFVPVTVGDRTFNWFEESYAAALTPKVAVELAMRFQQNAIYYVIDDELYLIACAEPRVFNKLGALTSRIV